MYYKEQSEFRSVFAYVDMRVLGSTKSYPLLNIIKLFMGMLTDLKFNNKVYLTL